MTGGVADVDSDPIPEMDVLGLCAAWLLLGSAYVMGVLLQSDLGYGFVAAALLVTLAVAYRNRRRMPWVNVRSTR